MLATSLPVNAYMLTDDPHYQNWVLEYAGAWRERARANGGNIPSIVGLNGVVGEGWGGRWCSGLMGWNRTSGGWGILGRGPRIGFANAMLLRGDTSIEALRAQGNNLLDNYIKTPDGLRLPDKYGDQDWPRPAAGAYREALYSDIYLITLTELIASGCTAPPCLPLTSGARHPSGSSNMKQGSLRVAT